MGGDVSRELAGTSHIRPGIYSGSNVLVIRLSSFGDVILTEPVTRTLKERYPGCRVTFVTNSDYAAIPSLFSSVDKVVPYLREGSNEALDELSGRMPFELVLDLQNNMRSRRITRRLRAGKVLKHRRQRFLRFLRVHMPRLWKGNLKGAVQTYFDVMSPLGIEPVGLTPRIEAPRSSVEQAKGRLAGGPFIAVCPGGSSEHKRWSTGRFAELVSTLRSRNHAVAVIGSDHDRLPVEAAAGSTGDPQVMTYVGNDIRLMAGLLSICPVTVTNDSGLMHLAAAVGSRVGAIFGSTSPALGFAPTARGCRVISLDLGCSPCSYHGTVPCRFGTRECFEEITVAMVADTVEGMLK